MMKNNIAVKVDHVSKYFKLPTESTYSLRTALVNRFRGIKGYKEYHVLKDINFEVNKGDFFWDCWTKWFRKVNPFKNYFSDLCA